MYFFIFILAQKRRCTDVFCCILFTILFITLFIIACVVFNKHNLMKSNYPTDYNGTVCHYNSQQKVYPFLYFNDINNIKDRKCVSDCPQQGKPIQCIGQKQCKINYYPNYPSDNQQGSFCLPEDKQSLKKIIQNSNLHLFGDQIKSITILLWGLLISFGLAILWMIISYFLPQITAKFAPILATITLIAIFLVYIIDLNNSIQDFKLFAIVFGIFALILAISFIYYFVCYSQRLNYAGIFMKSATQMIQSQKAIVLAYIPLFLALTIAFCILIVFQYAAFSSISQPKIDQSSIYLKLNWSYWLILPLAIQTIWGLSIIRDAFNFCVSGMTIQWYFRQQTNFIEPLKFLFCKHIGSIVGGAFINAFLYIPNFFITLFCNNSKNCCFNCLDLSRDEAYAYIYLTSNTYCPSVRQVQYLCNRSKICRGNQSANFVYSLSSRIFISLLSVLIVYGIMQNRLVYGIVNKYVLLGIFLISMYVVNYFIQLIVFVGQTIMICYLAQWNFDNNNSNQFQLAREQLISDLLKEQQKNDSNYIQKMNAKK